MMHLIHRNRVIETRAARFCFRCGPPSPAGQGFLHASFGYVLAGMEVVDAIAAVDTDGNDKPYDNVIIEKAVFVEPLQ